MSNVGVRELKDKLSRYLEDVRKGKRIAVTKRGRVIAFLVPAGRSREVEKAEDLVREGLAVWSGGVPAGAKKRIKIKGKPVAEVILEDRR
ncbi:MAG: type II toxin-antitoxin system prevent-host-death family antitoxin [Ignavibacteria bacterium]|nr:type II toxin-antitoxin system prevent-host-death family antitoxin [Ignavibacteria bacterium]